MFKNKTILITGGTGSFGKAFCNYLRKNHSPKKVIIFSRDEMKQWEMAKDFTESYFRYFIGDVRDESRLQMALEDVDYVIHAAATKIVPTAEYDPFECVKTNVFGAMNVISASLQSSSVKSVVALSTDKASSPINLYGATKLTSDKLFVAANNYSGKKQKKFSVVRYGNVMCSRGSVIPFFLSLEKNNRAPITDINMTRFMISLQQGVELVVTAFKESIGGEIFVKKIPSMKVIDIASSILGHDQKDIIGVRLGEKIHEQMISAEDSLTTYEYENFYKILPSINNWHKDKKRIKNGVKVCEGFTYSSDNNKDWMTKKQLINFLKENNYLDK
tara:strand:+ start:5712 stop:6704 length:993 start_codon:yes stop_codon:yes gene_type:complete